MAKHKEIFLVKYDDLMKRYSISRTTAYKWAQEAEAIYIVNGIQRVDVKKMDEFITSHNEKAQTTSQSRQYMNERRNELLEKTKDLANKNGKNREELKTNHLKEAELKAELQKIKARDVALNQEIEKNEMDKQKLGKEFDELTKRLQDKALEEHCKQCLI